MSDVSLENIKACKDAVDEYQRILGLNEEIAKRNTDKTAFYRAAHSVWTTKKQNFDNKLNSWKNKTGEYSHWNDKLASKHDNFWPDYCWGTGGCRDIQQSGDTNWQCGDKAEKSGKYDPWGYISDGHTQACGYDDGACIRNRRMRCSRSETSKQKINNDYNADMPTFTDTEPKDKEGQYAYDEQINNAGNIQCCANILKTGLGDTSNVSQSCSQQLTQLEQDITAAPPSTDSPPPSAGSPPPSAGSPPPASKPPKKLSNNVIIIVIICLFILSSFSIIGLFMLNTDEE